MVLLHPNGFVIPGWRPFPNVPGYWINELLQVKNSDGKIIVPHYCYAGLYVNKKQIRFCLKTAALQAYFPNTEGIVVNTKYKNQECTVMDLYWLDLDTQKREERTHPIYRNYFTGWRWIPGYEKLFLINHLSEVYTVSGQHMMRPDKNYMIRLTDTQGRRKPFTLGRISLLSIFPHISPLKTVDHINEDRHHNHIENLQWLSRKDNSSKSQVMNPRHGSSGMRKPLFLLDGKEGNVVKRYSFSLDAAEDLGIPRQSVITSARSMGIKPTWGRYFKYEEFTLLEGEVMKTSPTADRLLKQEHLPDTKKFMGTSLGRIRTPKGVIKRGCKVKRTGSGKYRQTGAGGRAWLDHQLIYMFFHDKEPPTQNTTNADGERLNICHDDNAPLDEDGCYLNYPDHLRLDTSQNNTLEYHASKRQRIG